MAAPKYAEFSASELAIVAAAEKRSRNSPTNQWNQIVGLYRNQLRESLLGPKGGEKQFQKMLPTLKREWLSAIKKPFDTAKGYDSYTGSYDMNWRRGSLGTPDRPKWGQTRPIGKQLASAAKTIGTIAAVGAAVVATGGALGVAGLGAGASAAGAAGAAGLAKGAEALGKTVSDVSKAVKPAVDVMKPTVSAVKTVAQSPGDLKDAPQTTPQLPPGETVAAAKKPLSPIGVLGTVVAIALIKKGLA